MAAVTHSRSDRAAKKKLPGGRDKAKKRAAAVEDTMFVRLLGQSSVGRGALLSSRRSSTSKKPDCLFVTSTSSSLPPRRCFSGSREGQVGFIGLGNMGKVNAEPVAFALLRVSSTAVVCGRGIDGGGCGHGDRSVLQVSPVEYYSQFVILNI